LLDHFVYDTYSLQLLRDDIGFLVGAKISGTARSLPEKTAPYRAWGLKIQEYLQSEDAVYDAKSWSRYAWGQTTSMPVDYPDRFPSMTSLTRAVVELGGDATRTLIGISRKLGYSVHDTILCSILWAIKATFALKDRSIIVSAIINQRMGLFDEIDVSRTVGNFAGGCDVPLEFPTQEDLYDAVSSLRRQLECIPKNGKTQSILSMADWEEIRHRNSRFMFNYLGRVSAKHETNIDPNDLVHIPDHAEESQDAPDPFDSPIYQFGDLVPGELYEVRLHFVERFMNHVGDRVFDILINGLVVRNNLDILSASGAKYRPIILEYDTRANDDGLVVIEFRSSYRSPHKALINAIEVTPANGGMYYKINSGGPAVSPYGADDHFTGGIVAAAGMGQLDLTGLDRPAPYDVYNSERYCNISYHNLEWCDMNIHCALSNRLRFDLQYPAVRYRQVTIEKLAQEILNFLHHFGTGANEWNGKVDFYVKQ